MKKKNVQKSKQVELVVNVVLTLAVLMAVIYVWVNRPKPDVQEAATGNGLALSNVFTNQTTANVTEEFVGEPTVYAATLPCSDCPAIDVTLELYPNGKFNEIFVRQGAEQETPNTDSGDWKIVSDLFGRSGTEFLVLSSNCRNIDVYFEETESGFVELESDGSEMNPAFGLAFRQV